MRSGPMYRIIQGLRALTAFARPLDESAAAQVLNPQLLELFRRMRRSERLHSLTVMQALRSAGHADPDLLVAALLHDCGKARWPITLPGRTLVVLVKALSPGLAARWSQGSPRGWRRPFVVAAYHAQWSAEDMAAHDAAPRAVALARRHQDEFSGPPETEEDRLLLLLMEADGSQ